MPACLLVLVGLPGSGKTSLARRLCSALSTAYRLVHVEYDAAVDLSEQARLQAAAAAGAGDDGWRAARRALERAVEAAVTGDEIPASLRPAIGPHESACPSETTETQRPTVFIIDDNMYLRSMRYRYFQLARRHQLGYAAVLLEVPLAECVRRNAARPRPVPEAAIAAMAARLERPERSRLWEARSVTLPGASPPEGGPVETERALAGPKDTERVLGALGKSEGLTPQEPVSAVAALIAAALSSPVAPLVDNSLETETARRVCSTSQLHQLDGQLRRLVGRHAAGCGSRASAANAARQRLMRRVRSGEVGLAVETAEEAKFAQAARGLFEAELAAAANE